MPEILIFLNKIRKIIISFCLSKSILINVLILQKTKFYFIYYCAFTNIFCLFFNCNLKFFFKYILIFF